MVMCYFRCAFCSSYLEMKITEIGKYQVLHLVLILRMRRGIDRRIRRFD